MHQDELQPEKGASSLGYLAERRVEDPKARDEGGERTTSTAILDQKQTLYEVPTGDPNPYTISSVKVGAKLDIRRLSPPNLAASEGIQLDDEIMLLVGGYIDSFQSVSRSIQFFNISSQQWIPDIVELPMEVAETHQGITVDNKSRMLYIISGQQGAGCMPATGVSVRVHLDTKEFQFLPILPEPRYAPGVEIVADATNPFIKHLHVFGGASQSRNQSATDHWRLEINEREPNLQDASWQTLEPVPDAGTHGVSFVSPNGFIYYTGFCTLDPGVVPSLSMAECHAHAAEYSKQMLHHVSDAGLTFRYPTAFARTEELCHWERMADMPFPICHAGYAFYKDTLYVIGGGYLTPQTKKGSAPSSLPIIQTFEVSSNSWKVLDFAVPKRAPLFLMSTWIDHYRKKLFSLHPGRSLVMVDLSVETPANRTVVSSSIRALREAFLQRTRSLAINTFNTCIREDTRTAGNETLMKNVFDDGYDNLRGTWNRRSRHLQYPDIVVLPKNVQQVSLVVQCARRTGYHVCGRNGRHSFDGSTCTNGIVIDVSRLDSVQVFDEETGLVRVGAGLTLGRVAVDLAPYGLTLPMGTCATVGVTGLVLNGGQGPLSRLYGMTSDHLESVELVDPGGNIINAAADNDNSDYFWLARGGGSVGYHYPGIITSLKFSDLPRMPQNRTMWTRVRIRYEATVQKAVDVLLAWQTLHTEDDLLEHPLFRRVTAEPWLFMEYKKRRKKFAPALYMVIYFFGEDHLHEQFRVKHLSRFEQMVTGGTIQSMERMEDLFFHRKLGGVKTNADLASGNKGHDLNKTWKGLSAVASQPVPESAFRSLAETIFLSQPLYRRYAELKPLGGTIRENSMGKQDTAFWHRDALWWVLVSHFHDDEASKDDDPTFSAAKELVFAESSRRHMDFVTQMGKSFAGMYAGYVDHGNATGRDLAIYYGGNADRIRQIKRFRDPHNLFRNYLPNNAPKE